LRLAQSIQTEVPEISLEFDKFESKKVCSIKVSSIHKFERNKYQNYSTNWYLQLMLYDMLYFIKIKVSNQYLQIRQFCR